MTSTGRDRRSLVCAHPGSIGRTDQTDHSSLCRPEGPFRWPGSLSLDYLSSLSGEHGTSWQLLCDTPGSTGNEEDSLRLSVPWHPCSRLLSNAICPKFSGNFRMAAAHRMSKVTEGSMPCTLRGWPVAEGVGLPYQKPSQTLVLASSPTLLFHLCK